MEIVSFWLITSVFIINMPTYNNQTIRTENVVTLQIPHESKKDCDRIASSMFKNMKKDEKKDDLQKLNRIYCSEQFKIIYHDRSLSNRTQGNGPGSIPDS